MTDEQILTEIQIRQQKIEQLYKLYNKPITGVQIWYNDSETTISIGQTTFPFNLANEVRMLILESVLYYENEIIELKNKF